MPLTGGFGKLGQMMLEGSQLAVDEINAEGSRKIELIAEDSQALAKNGIDGFRKLAEVDKVPFVITGWTADCCGNCSAWQRNRRSTFYPLVRRRLHCGRCPPTSSPRGCSMTKQSG